MNSYGDMRKINPNTYNEEVRTCTSKNLFINIFISLSICTLNIKIILIKNAILVTRIQSNILYY